MKRKTTKRLMTVILFSALMVGGCSGAGNGGDAKSYKMISQDEAMRIMSEDGDYILLDVRTLEEFDEGHIPGAVCIPNEMIGDKEIPELGDEKDRTILVYCRSGRRSKEAAEKLAALGYTDVREFGGIITWTGDIVTSYEEE